MRIWGLGIGVEGLGSGVGGRGCGAAFDQILSRSMGDAIKRCRLCTRISRVLLLLLLYYSQA